MAIFFFESPGLRRGTKIYKQLFASLVTCSTHRKQCLQPVESTIDARLSPEYHALASFQCASLGHRQNASCQARQSLMIPTFTPRSPVLPDIIPSHVYGLEGWANASPAALFGQYTPLDPPFPLNGFLRSLDPNPRPLAHLKAGVSLVSEVRVSSRHQQSSSARPDTGATESHATVSFQRGGLRQDASCPSRQSFVTFMVRFWLLILSGKIHSHGCGSRAGPAHHLPFILDHSKPRYPLPL